MDESQQDLWERFIRNECTAAEIEELLAQFNDATNEVDLRLLIEAELNKEVTHIDPTLPNLEEKEAAIYAALLPHIREERKHSLWPRIAAAAGVLLVIGTGAYFITRKSPQPLVADDVQPFTGKVILHTGHGQKLALEKTRKGMISEAVVKNTDDALSYHATNRETIYDTLEITAGGRPQKVDLADGSQVTLNVASKLRYPENFRSGSSVLELIEGEAYFDIKHDLSKPVTVKAKDQTIADIGTGFNVNAYDNEPESRTTLAEGNIKVNARALIPGQQAVITANSFTIVKANLVQVMAWKDGYFRFNGEHIQVVMRELARAYNVEVVYEGKPTEVGFFLRITRSRNISEVLKALEKITNTVHFKVEGRRVIVLGKKNT